MKEITNIVKKYNSLIKTSTKLALATVIDVEGSSYRRTGARMLIQDNGLWTGGISGGCIEGNALKKAHLAISGKKAVQVTYDTSNENEQNIGVSLGCNGIISVLIAPIDYNDKNNPVEQLKKCIDNRQASLLITVIEADERLTITSGEVIKYTNVEQLKTSFGPHFEQTIYQDIEEVVASGKSRIESYASCKLFIEFIPPAIQVIIMGGNYDVYPLLKIANNLGWRTIIIGNARRLDKNIIHLANEVIEDFDKVSVDDHSVAIIMGHDYNADLKNLEKALLSQLSYIGLLGPAKRRAELLADLPFKIDKRQKDRIFGPAGLDIGASQPEEITISIVAEILSFMRNRPGGSLKFRKGPIYTR